MIPQILLIAQTTQPNAAAPQGLESMLPMLAVMGIVIYFLMIRPQSKERKARTAMLAAVKKNDRVVTIGGILGTVLAVKDDEITLKVDESSNTKITFTRSAIQRVASTSPGESPEAAAVKK
jgi:preprotein translocase subunit YajC